MFKDGRPCPLPACQSGEGRGEGTLTQAGSLSCITGKRGKKTSLIEGCLDHQDVRETALEVCSHVWMFSKLSLKPVKTQSYLHPECKQRWPSGSVNRRLLEGDLILSRCLCASAPWEGSLLSGRRGTWSRDPQLGQRTDKSEETATALAPSRRGVWICY